MEEPEEYPFPWSISQGQPSQVYAANGELIFSVKAPFYGAHKFIVHVCNLFAARNKRKDAPMDLSKSIFDEGNGIACPFCNKKGFDRQGLKYHLTTYCEDFK